jgi:curved DNA-binding protein CbpA
MNPYEVLELSVGASPDEIKAAYHSLAKKWHPDRYTGEAKAEAEQQFRRLAEAYNLLKDVPPRREEDRSPAAPAPVQPGGTAEGAPIQLDSAEAKPSANRGADDWFKDAKAALEAKAPEKALGLIQYAIRMDPERAEFHAFHGKLLDLTDGDKRIQVRALETALRLNPRDVDSTVLLAQTFQALGMHARASRLWNVVHNLAPNHPIFSPAGGKAVQGQKGGSAAPQGMREQFEALMTNTVAAVSRIFKRG